MLVSRVLEVREDGPVAALQAFLAGLMHAAGASRILAPVETPDGEVTPEVLEGDAGIARVNPLLPTMHADAVAVLRGAVRSDPARGTLAVLRPCEVSAASRLAREGSLDLAGTVVVGMDCLSVFERSCWDERCGAPPNAASRLAAEALSLARSGQAQMEGTRLGCQLCDRPAADYRAADVLIGLVGVPNHARLLILADEARDARWDLVAHTDRPATEREVADREIAVWRLTERRRQAAAAKLASLGLSPWDLAAARRHLETCTACGACIDPCPGWREELRAARERGRDELIQAMLSAMQGLADCAECGLCQMECGEGVPLIAILRSVGGRAQAHLPLKAGRAERDALTRVL